MIRYPVSGLSRYLPTEWSALQFNSTGKSLWVLLGIAGVLVGVGLAFRARHGRALFQLSVGWLFLAAVAHGLTIWLLAVDPGRGSVANIPAPFAWALAQLAFVLLTAAPFVGAALIGAAAVELLKRRHALIGAAAAAVAVYSLWVAPWVATVYFD